MKPTQALHEAGQSLWLDNITRALLDEGILARYVDEYSVTGLTSNPAIFDKAIRTAPPTTPTSRLQGHRASAQEVFFEVEDAAVGVQAAKAGGMAAVGVARLGEERALADAGADLVVLTLDEVSRRALAQGRLERKKPERNTEA